jgi:hypothetical protein
VPDGALNAHLDDVGAVRTRSKPLDEVGRALPRRDATKFRTGEVVRIL